VIFLLAIIHTFLAAKFIAIGHKFNHEHEALMREVPEGPESHFHFNKVDRKKFLAVLFHFLGEVEAVFGIWLIPLSVAIIAMKGLGTTEHYINGVNFTEPIFVVVIMAIASSRPIMHFAEAGLKQVANVGSGSPAAWWFAILTVGPIMGSFITEPAAMTICAMLLASKFYTLQPSMTLRYATLGMLFVNVSIGGTLTHFAAPPVVMVAGKWGWDTPFMLMHFGWKVLLPTALANVVLVATSMALQQLFGAVGHFIAVGIAGCLATIVLWVAYLHWKARKSGDEASRLPIRRESVVRAIAARMPVED
jgi:hypothetical protein